MPKPRTVFVCSSCGADAPRWSGQCPSCGEWNTLAAFAEARARGLVRKNAGGGARPAAVAQLVTESDARMSTGFAEFDRVLGGGLVPGSVTLIGGEPGIGKSTLLLQCAAALAREQPVLYATGEESVRQVAERARRLAVDAGGLKLVAETELERILEHAGEAGARALVVDSIQTMSVAEVDAAPGAVTQLRESTASLVRHAKSTGAAVLLIGHVTREGVIAGPRVLEHMVDTVLYFESDSGSRFRVVRAVKNRFGAVNEIGVFAMDERGLREVRNPSAIFLARGKDAMPGSAVTVAREGTRQMLIEVQGLVDASALANPRRVAVGFEANRVALLLAVLHRHAGIALHEQDVFVNVVGGVRLVETAADLAVVAALLSSLNGRALPQDLVVFGELGLTGEIRPVPYGEERLREAAKHGFRRAVVPQANLPRQMPEGILATGAATIADAIVALG
ncbi:MAG TPA: DNA repair protein RadA [Steroidobacteraceae bacterium]|nr:DNA repair protein RadA [Steroidobacteraceae bacterium]